MRKGALFSGLLHLAVTLIAFFGLPSLFAPTETQQPISVQVVDIADVTTPPKQEEKPAPKPVKPEPQKPEPPDPEPPKPEAQQEPPPAPAVEPEQEPAPPEPEPVVAPPPPEPVPEPKQTPEPEPEVAKAEPLPVPQVKPEPPKKTAEKKVAENKPEEPEEEEPEERSFTSVLKNVEKLKQQAAAEPEPSPEPTPAAAAEDRNLSSEPLTVSEIDAIRAQIERCWIVDPGMKGIEDITVEIVTTLNPDGSVNRAYWKDQNRYNSDKLYRVVAESARRAVLKCSPLKIPQKKYATWKEVTLVFNAREMLGL
ncbi:cell envelope integrity protein TolA [Rhodospirillaceae bacterium SYSU D60014]|uniref:cell envelope integrity protein TolA n=1 Tax=Virgifigura deserti TaxID=2268457 RepID=UPI000E673580